MLQRQLFDMYQRRKRRLAVPTMVADVYVDINATGANDGTSWVNAYTNLQVAVTASVVDDLIAVNDGVYAPIDTDNKRITIESVNGAAVTIIDGNGTDRCATLGTAADHVNTVLNGFTLTNGFTTGNGGGSLSGTLNNCVISGNTAEYGGGSAYGTLTGCTISGNTADREGGGSYASTLTDCTLTENTANNYGGGSYYGTLTDCTISGNTANSGGGSSGGTLTGCTISGNMAFSDGGGIYAGTAYDSLIVGNVAERRGGALTRGKYYNCTIYGNTAPDYAVGYANGSPSEPSLYNCVVYGNVNTGANARHLEIPASGVFAFSSIDGANRFNPYTPLTPEQFVQSIYGDPLFTDPTNNDFTLQPSSPCIDTGSNDLVVGDKDLDGNPRIFGGTVDMGAYEFQGE